MWAQRIRFERGGIHLPGLGLWLDPHDPKTGPERVFVSHAHSDHIAAHREVILSAVTARFLRARQAAPRVEHVLAFGGRTECVGAEAPFHLTLLPAGHIFGSAMAFVETTEGSLLYTGDFKLRPGQSAEPCEPRQADTLIMETTYGRPEYRFPPTDQVIAGVVRFCRKALDNDETPVLLGYSLGKSQELLRNLRNAGLPLMLHEQVFRLTQIYEQLGQQFPPYERLDLAEAKARVLICPPGANHARLLHRVGPVRTAVLTGWAVDPDCRFRYRADAAFPLSDHADFPELIEMAKRVAPRKVYTLHGFAADFAQTLRELGFDAQALTEDDQLGLPLVMASPPADPHNAKPREATLTRGITPEGSPPCAAGMVATGEAFAVFTSTCEAIAATRAKLEKVRLLAAYLNKVGSECLPQVVTWFIGHPFPPAQNKVLQLGWALLRDVLCTVAGIPPADFQRVYLTHSDLGETAWELLTPGAPSAPALSLRDVASLFDQLEAARGPTAKHPCLEGALRLCTPIEAKYLVKIVTGDLRIGLKEGLVEEAIAQACGVSLEAIQRAGLLAGDIGEVAWLARRRELGVLGLRLFRPVKLMLASPEATAANIWQRVQEWQASRQASSNADGPSNMETGAASGLVWVEDKYDGIRCQLHKLGGRIALYSRDLKEVTQTFSEIAEAARTLEADVILDGELLAMRGAEVLPFAELQKRLGRREADLFLSEEIPVRFIVFDVLWQSGQTLLDEPLRVRREALARLTPWPKLFEPSRVVRVDSAAEIDTAFDAARRRGNEGLMIKDPESRYWPGRRGLSWLKLKRALATL